MLSLNQRVKSKLKKIKQFRVRSNCSFANCCYFLEKINPIGNEEENELINTAIIALNYNPYEKEKLDIANVLYDYIDYIEKVEQLEKINILNVLDHTGILTFIFSIIIGLCLTFSALFFITIGFISFMCSSPFMFIVSGSITGALALILILLIPVIFIKNKIAHQIFKQKKLHKMNLLAKTVQSTCNEKNISFESLIKKTKKLFDFPNQTKLDISNLEFLSTHDLIKIFTRILGLNTDKENIFLKHIGDKSDYPFKLALKESMQILYFRLQGKFDESLGKINEDEKKIIITKIREGILYCSEGLHNRINSIIEAFYQPINLNGLLYNVRKWLFIQRAIKVKNDVHTINHFAIIAQNLGYGIRADFPEDRYRSDLSDSNIASILKRQVEKHYTLSTLPRLLADQLRGILVKKGYTGYKTTGSYTCSDTGESEVEKFVKTIKIYMLNPEIQATIWNKFFIIEEESSCILDLDWSFIESCFFKTLVNRNYFHLDLSEKSFVPFVFYPSKEIINIINFIKVSNKFLEEDSKKQLLEKILRKNSQGWNILMREARMQPKNFYQILSFLINDLNISSYQILEFILQKNNHGWNTWTLAIRHQSEALKQLVTYLSEINYSQKVFFQLFLKKNDQGYNSLMLAAKYQPKSLEILLSHLYQYDFKFDKVALLNLLLQRKSGTESVWELAMLYQPFSAKIILDFSIKYDLFSNETIESALFISHHNTMQNALFLLIKNYKNNFSLIEMVQKFTNKYPVFSEKNLTDLTLQKSLTNVKSRILFFLSKPDKILPTKLERSEKNYSKL